MAFMKSVRALAGAGYWIGMHVFVAGLATNGTARKRVRDFGPFKDPCFLNVAYYPFRKAY